MFIGVETLFDKLFSVILFVQLLSTFPPVELKGIERNKKKTLTNAVVCQQYSLCGHKKKKLNFYECTCHVLMY